MPRPVVALLTDFGLRDHYVGAMKGVILGLAPDTVLVDITHDIAPQDVLSAALELAACWSDFPGGSIFLVVVDPGVGTPRRAIAAAAGDRFFVAPDNGVLGLVFAEQPPAVIVELTEPSYQRPIVSRTFEGRDRFAPVAGWLARGTDIRAFGPARDQYVRLDIPHPRASGRAAIGEVLKVDRFGNLISNIGAEWLARLGHAPGMLVRAGDGEAVPLVETYGVVRAGVACALVGSSGRVEVAVNGSSAAQLLGLGRGARVVLAADREALDAADGE